MKLCKDCKHNRRDWLFGQMFARCAGIPRPTDGRPMWFCETERHEAFDRVSPCGSTGKLWERRKPLLERLIQWVRK